jgi:hypothetical protein
MRLANWGLIGKPRLTFQSTGLEQPTILQKAVVDMFFFLSHFSIGESAEVLSAIIVTTLGCRHAKSKTLLCKY